MSIGITERGDIEFDNEWMFKFHKMDFCILISKGLPPINGQNFMKNNADKIIFHATTTGYGGTILEPNVIPYVERLNKLKAFCDDGFPMNQVVVRVDPIISTEKGVALAKNVIQYAYNLGFRRFRYSFIDMYTHVKARFAKKHIPIPVQDVSLAKAMFDEFENKYGEEICFESCAENTKHQTGCISKKDIKILNLDENYFNMSGSSHQRAGCLCPACKKELLIRKGVCPNKCLYCYWQD